MAIYRFEIFGTSFNRYILGNPSISLRASSRVNAFTIEGSSIGLTLIKNETTLLIVEKNTLLKIYRNSVLIWDGYPNIESYSEDEGDEVFSISFLSSITRLKELSGFPYGTITPDETISYIVNNSGEFVKTLSDDIIDEDGYIRQYCTLKTDDPPPDPVYPVHEGFTFGTNEEQLFLTPTSGGTLGVAIRIIENGTLDNWTMDFNSDLSFDAPVLFSSGTWYNIPTQVVNVPFFGEVNGVYFGASGSQFLFYHEGSVYSYGSQVVTESFVLTSFESDVFSSIIADVCYFTDSIAYLLGNKLTFKSIGGSISLTTKVFSHSITKDYFSYNYSLNGSHDLTAFSYRYLDRLTDFYRQKYLSGITEGNFDKHIIIVSDSITTNLELGSELTLNGESVGRISEIIYNQNDNTVKIITINYLTLQDELGEELVLNGNFEEWGETLPTSWLQSGGDVNNYITRDGSNNAFRLVSNGTYVGLHQSPNVLTSGKTYRMLIYIESITGSFYFQNKGGEIVQSFSSTGLKVVEFTAEDIYLRLNRSGVCNAVVSYVSIKEIL